jgi:hypothetical protein
MYSSKRFDFPSSSVDERYVAAAAWLRVLSALHVLEITVGLFYHRRIQRYYWLFLLLVLVCAGKRSSSGALSPRTLKLKKNQHTVAYLTRSITPTVEGGYVRSDNSTKIEII